MELIKLMVLIDNLKKSDQLNFEHVILELDKSNFFLIDDHLNTFGHQSVATKLSEILKFKKNN